MGPLVAGNEVVGGALARKLGIKLLQRLALTFLEPRLAPWRYCRDQGGDLELALAGGLAASAGDGETGKEKGAEEAGEKEEEEEYEIAEEIEEVVEHLLTVSCIPWGGSKLTTLSCTSSTAVLHLLNFCSTVYF